MTTADESTFQLLAVQTRAPADAKSLGGDRVVRIERRVDEMREALAREVDKLDTLFETLGHKAGEFACDEIELTLQVTAEGGFEMIGSAKVGAAASFLLRFKRVADPLAPTRH